MHDFATSSYRCIEVEIQNLQGKPVTVGALQEVKCRQSLYKCLFNGVGGYLGFLADVGDHDYLKYYVDHSVDVAERDPRHNLNLFSLCI